MTRRVVCYTDTTGFGGAEKELLHLLEGLDRRRWQPVLVYHPAPGVAPLLSAAEALGVELCPTPALLMGREGLLRLPGFVRLLRRLRPAVFHAHLTWPLACKYGLLGAWLARVPAVVATEQLFMPLPYNRMERIQQRLLAFAVGRYIAVSAGVARRLYAAFRIPSARTAIVPNAIALQPFANLPADPPPGPPLVLTVARLDPQKGLAYLVRAAALAPEAVFAIAGDGPEHESLAALARELGVSDRVQFLGHRSDVPQLIGGCTVFVLPSLYEGLPLSVLEAMAARRPVVATRTLGTREAVVDGETGLLVPPADEQALAAAIRRVLADPVLAARLGRAGRARVERSFSAEVMVRQVEEIYEALLSRAPRPQPGAELAEQPQVDLAFEAAGAQQHVAAQVN